MSKEGKEEAAPPGTPSDMKMLDKKGYEVGKMLGEGAYARVYLATFRSSKAKPVKLACKVVDSDKAPPEFLKTFFPRELDIMKKVNHPNLVRIHSVIQRKDRYFIFMQFAEGGDLLEFIKTSGPVKEVQLRNWFFQLVAGMSYMHGIHICHRDLKCENLLLTSALNIKISDFGFSRHWKRGVDSKAKTYCGSISYCAPEIIRGIPYDPLHADTWSMGVILYILVCRAMPFDDKSLKQMYDKQVMRGWKIRGKHAKASSNDLKNMIYLLLEPVPERRMSCAQMFKHPWIKGTGNPTGGGKK